MLKKVVTLVVIVFLWASVGSAVQVSGVNVADSISTGGTDLFLNGAGKRTKFFIDAYVGGLYLKAENSDAQAIIDADEPMAIVLHITSGMVTSDKMESATREGFDNATGGNIEPIKDRIDVFIDVFREKINQGDVYEFVNVPGKGVEVYKNGNAVTVVPGMDFKKALFGIWLGDKPAQKNLKNSMLGL
ncbi:MAG TPA: chalcone isomerase [Deltaproteobacteria bacterium]|nr:chalcone isomerase [Deltaproteobacteria bacterium]